MKNISLFRYISLFSGIGSPEEAMENLGIDIDLVGFSEIDKFAVKSYCALHDVDENLNLGDITKIDIESLPMDIDLITHGSPCQDFSVAGEGAGGDKGTGTRSSLMWNTVAICEHCKPKVVIWENVKNVLSKKHRHNFDRYLSEMGRIGYNNFYKVLNAKDFGVPQNRERVFVVSIRNDIQEFFKFPEGFDSGIRLKDILENEVDEKYYIPTEKAEKLIKEFKENYKKAAVCACLTPDRLEKRQNGRRFKKDGEPMFTLTGQDRHGILQIGMLDIKGNEQVRRVYSAEGVSPTLNTMQGGNRQPKVIIDDTKSFDMGYRIRKLTPLESWLLMGFKEEQFRKAEKVCSNSQLYKQAGNAIVVTVLEKILLEILKCIK